MEEISKFKITRRGYGLDEIALRPTERTIDPEDVDISVKIGCYEFSIPVIASAMDSVVNPFIAVELSKYGALGVINLQGIQTRYDDPLPVLEEIAAASTDDFVTVMQRLYEEPIKPDLIVKRIQEVKSHGAIAAVSSVPQMAAEFGPIARDAGADIFVLQATVIAPKHISSKGNILNIKEFCSMMEIPVIVGNTVGFSSTIGLMRQGASAVLIGVGPGAACTTRGVLGIGVPQATAISEAAAARDMFFNETGKYIPIIADGGMVNSGDMIKALAVGADAVMIGSPIARAQEAPGMGFHWGMATPNSVLPRGTRIRVGTVGTLKEILVGPARFDYGCHNIAGAMVLSLATLGVKTIRELHNIEVIVAPSLLTEGKVYQKAQKLGMGK
ncbi:IMP dehydrogenase [Thermodesulfobium acidiphilum]|uniref:IMP dehydrogenase n=1 Tax=Thermodesulfobium acidiphilum TaxID=1794699 RepID=A0A2R4W1A9_THEAF|nr:GuaB3 family IMP dehydrogenase-related protein [Thermodesulfobium acidiphilum]AWB10607.1 IMP dehydrogenase [Thermodesulfobium acidiphilum]